MSGKRYTVIVKTRSSTPGVEKTSSDTLIVRVHEAPADGKANEAVIRHIALYCGVPKSAVSIRAGTTSRNKIVEVAV